MDGERAKARLARARHRMQSTPTAVQYLLIALGVLLVLAGVVMLVTPGPAIVILPLGLALLSVRSERARRAADGVIDLSVRLSKLPMRTKVLLGLAGLLVVAGAAAAYLASR